MGSEPYPVPQLLIPLESGTCFPICLLSGGVWTIGRGGDNAIVLKHKLVSRKHAVVQSVEMGSVYLVYFTDLGSLNGSRINNQPVTTPVLLQHGDVITIAETDLKFYFPCNP